MSLIILAIFLSWIESGMDYFISLNRPKKLTPEYYSNSDAWHSLSALYYIIIVAALCILKYPNDLLEVALKFIWMLLIRWFFLDGFLGVLFKRGFFYVGTTSWLDKKTRRWAVSISSIHKKVNITYKLLSAILKLITFVVVLVLDIMF